MYELEEEIIEMEKLLLECHDCQEISGETYKKLSSQLALIKQNYYDKVF